MRRWVLAIGGSMCVATFLVGTQATSRLWAQAPARKGQPAAAAPAAGAALSSYEQKYSYCIGMDVGANLKSQGIELDMSSFVAGMTAMLKGEKPALSDEEINAVMKEFTEQLKATAELKVAKLAEANLAEANAFLTKNKDAEGVKVTKTGLQYQVVKAGKGKPPGAEDQVTVHYKGQFLDGTVFDSSMGDDGKGEPAQFKANEVIPGWVEGLQLMTPGSKFRFFVPPDLAYGEAGYRGIPPNMLLVFEVELIKVN